MRIHWIRAWTAAAVLVTPVAAMAQLTAARERTFRERDRNGDGVLTQEEYGGHVGNFRAMDANGDHVLSRDEFVNRYREGNEPAPAQQAQPDVSASLPDHFAMSDRNGDNVITRAEWRRELVTANFAQTDRNHDGVVTRDEFANPLPATSAEARFGEMDRNNDGLVTRGEWRADPFSFNRADRNDDNRVTVDEYVNPPSAGAAERRFAVLDRNGNGVINRGEWRGETLHFDDVDRNNDNRITLDEYVEMAGVGSGTGGDDPEARFARFDRNRDGVLSRSEWRDTTDFRRADRNGDGVVTRREYLYGNVVYDPDDDHPTSSEDRFRDLDRNGNGYISRSEWPYDRSEFDMLDQDRDGRLTSYEYSDTQTTAGQFGRLDYDGNGVISRREWTGTSASFSAYDRNRDGVISRDEYLYR